MMDDAPDITQDQSDEFTQSLAYSLTERSVLGSRFSAHLFNQIKDQLEHLHAQISMAIISANVGGVSRLAARRARLAHLINDVSELVSNVYADIARETGSQIEDLVGVELRGVRKAIAGAASDAGIDLNVNPVSGAMVDHLKADAIVNGQTLDEIWNAQAANVTASIAKELRASQNAGEDIGAALDRVLGSDDIAGVLPKASNAAESIINSTVAAAQNRVVAGYASSNRKAFDALMHVSVLDNRTSYICLSRSGLKWDAETKEPLGHDAPFAEPPLHPHCRSILALTKSGSTVGKKLNAQTWLERMSIKRQNDVLGPGRAKLFREGKISVRDLTDQSGRPLTLAELDEL